MKLLTYSILAIAVVVAVIFGWLVATVLAISNPDSISFGTGAPSYKAFENCLETGDMLFVAEGYVYYAVEPTDYDADEAFIFEVLDTDNSTLLSTPITDYGDRPISVYQSANACATKGLVSGTGYKYRISGNPIIFATMSGNSVNVTLTAGDWIDQSVATDEANPLRNYIIGMAQTIEDNDTPTDDYLTWVSGQRYLTSAGANIFLNGIPGLFQLCPTAFQYSIENLEGDAPESTGSYALTLTPELKWGTTTANGLTSIGVFLGINQALAGSVVLFALAIALAVYLYSRTQSGILSLLVVSGTPLFGAYLGLMPLALAFILVIFIAILLGYFFFSRGAL